MTIETVRCAKTWTPKEGCIPGGPEVTVDSDRPQVVVVDGRPLPVASWAYMPERQVHPPRSVPYAILAGIEARLPMENGAVLDITWPERDEVMVSIGRDEPDGWRPLVEKPNLLAIAHRGCIGPHCDYFGCMFDFLDRPDDWTIETIITAWKRCGVKPIDLTDEQWPKPNRAAKSRLTKLERALRGGKTVTLDEWKKMTG